MAKSASTVRLYFDVGESFLSGRGRREGQGIKG